MKTQIIEIKTGSTPINQIVEAVQGDSGRVLRCIISDMSIPAGSTARFYAVKPSGAEIYNDCAIDGQAVLLNMTTQMLAEVGTLNGQIEVTNSGKTVTSFSFCVNVIKNIKSNSAIESSNEFTALDNALKDAEGAAYKAVSEYAAANGLTTGATPEQVEQIAQNTLGIDELKSDITNNKKTIAGIETDLSANKKSINELNDKKITKFYSSNLGETTLNDSDNGKIQDMFIFGKGYQYQGNIELEDGTTVTVPCPDYPQEIKSVVNPVVKVCGKNLCDGITQNYWINGSGTVCGVSENNTGLIIDVSNNSIITISSKVIQERYRTCFINDLLEINTDTSNIYGAAIKDGTSDSITMATNGYKYLVVNATDLSSIQVEIGNKATEYEPYKEQLATLPYTLNAIPVSSGGNVTIDGQQYIADYVDIENGKLHRLVDSSLFDTSVSLIDNTDWLLSSEVITDLTDEQVNALKALSTYYPTTNVAVTSDELDGYVTFNYPISMKNGWDYIKQQLGDTRDYIYDMELQSAEAFVNSEYAVALTELGV